MLDRLIGSEITDLNRESWTEYRNSLTEYIIDSIRHRELKRKLKATGRLRDKSYSIEELVNTYVANNGVKPSLAIWGAGGCNDIDIERLSKYFRLILIDRNLTQLEKVREQHKFSNTDCACIDIKFFDVSYSDYEMFEAMLLDRCSKEELINFLEEIVDKAIIDNELMYKVNYSLAAGLASQLVSRFAALAYSYGRLEELKEKLHEISNLAVESMHQTIVNMTESLIIYDYEINSIKDINSNIEELKLHLKEQIEEISCEEGINQVIYNEIMSSEVEGNQHLVEILRKHFLNDNRFDILDIDICVWPFSKDKSYIMSMLSIDLV